MKILFKAICESAIVDRESGNLSIIGIFENVISDKFPAVHPRACFVFSVSGNPGQRGEYSFDVTDSSGNKIFDGASKPREYAIGPNGKVNLIANLVGLNLPHKGVYSANFSFGDMKDSIEFNALSPNE